MRRLAQLLVAVTTCLTVPLVAPATRPALAATHTAPVDLAFLHRMLDDTPLASFATLAASAQRDPWYDWTTDWCSAPLVGTTGVTFDFHTPCRRHDFAYRNLQRIDRRYGTRAWNSANRLWADQRFLADLRRHCSGRTWWQRPTCYAWAQTFYTAVRTFGGP